VKESCHVEELDVGERILKWISKKQKDSVWAGFIWLRIGAKTNKGAEIA
jgi:hypothetical protein